MHQLLIPSPRLLIPRTQLPFQQHSISYPSKDILITHKYKNSCFLFKYWVASRTNKRRKQRTLKENQNKLRKDTYLHGLGNASLPTNPAQGQIEKTNGNSWKAISCQNWRWNSKFYSSHPQFKVWFTQSLI